MSLSAHLLLTLLALTAVERVCVSSASAVSELLIAAAAAAAVAADASAASHFEHQVERLLRSLSLEEKLSQLSTESPAIERNGSTLIPAFNWWSECLHGAVVGSEDLAAKKGKTLFSNAGATCFPQPIGLAATFDRRLVRRVASAIGDELRAYSNDAERRGRGPRCVAAGSWDWMLPPSAPSASAPFMQQHTLLPCAPRPVHTLQADQLLCPQHQHFSRPALGAGQRDVWGGPAAHRTAGGRLCQARAGGSSGRQVVSCWHGRGMHAA